MSAHSSSDEFDEDRGRGKEPGGGRPEEEEEDDDEEDDDDDEDSEDDESEEDSKLHKAPEGLYDPADYANLPVSTDIKELFQYITR